MKPKEDTDSSNSNPRPPKVKVSKTRKFMEVFVIMSVANLTTSILEKVFFADVGSTLHRVIFMSAWGFFYFMYEKYRSV